MHHISGKWRYISLQERLEASLQWADSSERIHFSLGRHNPKVSFTEELQTFRHHSLTQRRVQGFSFMRSGYKSRKRGCTGPESEHQLRVWLWINWGTKWGKKRSICQQTTAAKDIWSFALEGLVLEKLDYLFWSFVLYLLGLPERNYSQRGTIKFIACHNEGFL